MAGGAVGEARDEDARRVGLVGDHRTLGEQGPDGRRGALGVEGAGGALGTAGRLPRRPVGSRPQGVGQRLEGAGGVLVRLGQHLHLAAVGDERAGEARVGEERHGRRGIDEHQMPDPLELGDGEFGQVAEPLHGREARAPLQDGGKGLTQELRPGRHRHPTGGHQPALAQGGAPDEQRGGRARLQGLDGGGHGVVVRFPAGRSPGAAGRGRPPPARTGRRGRRAWPHPTGGPWAPATASAVSPARSAGVAAARNQVDTGRARLSMSVARGGSRCRWVVAWSPMTFTMGVRARRALWRLAMPLPRPGPRCRRVAAGRPAIRP